MAWLSTHLCCPRFDYNWINQVSSGCQTIWMFLVHSMHRLVCIGSWCTFGYGISMEPSFGTCLCWPLWKHLVKGKQQNNYHFRIPFCILSKIHFSCLRCNFSSAICMDCPPIRNDCLWFPCKWDSIVSSIASRLDTVPLGSSKTIDRSVRRLRQVDISICNQIWNIMRKGTFDSLFV